ncbi:MAG: glycerate kinase [Roseiflexaceae bacterium]
MHQRFQTHTTRHHPHGQLLCELLVAATHAADPRHQIACTLHSDATHVLIGNETFTPRGVVLLAVGKAAQTMAAAAAERLGAHLSHGLVIYKDDEGVARHPRLHYHAAGHPVPDARSLQAGMLARQLVAQTSADQLIVVLLSGGGSALMCDPYPGITLPMMQQLTRDLLACGADITAINTIRRRIDRVKGGGLLQAAGTTPIRTLILSDVIGNPLAAIASGPTVPNPDDAQAAWQVVRNAGIHVDAAIATILDAPLVALPSTSVAPLIIGDIRSALTAVATAAHAAGYAPIVLSDRLDGEARAVGRTLAHITAYQAQQTARGCVIAGGETTVTLRGTGRGGRNQELALSAAMGIAGQPSLLAAAYATDGSDGPTDAAGAVISGDTLARAHQPMARLANNDSYTLFAELDDLLKPGATGTNVNDLFVALW